jgi:hypothetical protein
VRLRDVERGDGLKSKLLFGMIRVLSGYRAVDVIRTLVYHPSFFGKPHCDHTEAAMRGPSTWSVGERELFAAYVSRVNSCQF